MGGGVDDITHQPKGRVEELIDELEGEFRELPESERAEVVTGLLTRFDFVRAPK